MKQEEQKQIETICNQWKCLQFEFVNKTDKIKILKNSEVIYQFLDDNITLLNNLLNESPVSTEPANQQINQLLERMNEAQEIIDDLVSNQMNLINLQPIFDCEAFCRGLPETSKEFGKVAVNFARMMEIAEETKTVEKFLEQRNEQSALKKELESDQQQLNMIQKQLSKLLEEIRQEFPRFYFLSNDELLEIIIQTLIDPHSIQTSVKKLFDNIVRLQLEGTKESTIITGMISEENEVVKFPKDSIISTQKEVQKWLKQLESIMKSTLLQKFQEAAKDLENKERTEWILNGQWPTQAIITVSYIQWTELTEAHIVSKEMTEWLAHLIAQFHDLVYLLPGNLSVLQRQMIAALITQDIHLRDITDNLYLDIQHVEDFKWQQQLRFYWPANSRDSVQIKQMSTELDYGFEYEGATSRLVITPLTDKCWMTITSALKLNLGACPSGPAGTGKTESVKDLAKGIGMWCIVLNCSDQIDYLMMGKFFNGVCQQGAWVCMDEFNRICIEVLSIIGQQLLQIREGQMKKASSFSFEGTVIPIKQSLGIFITMNPGYAGRTELPDNLKQFFRPCAMMIPDCGLIVENMLFAEGFQQATALSRKLVSIFKVCSEQLTKQHQYDFGLRAIKCVVVMAGKRKSNNRGLEEEVILINSLQRLILPKLCENDIPLFYGIIQDFFPGIAIPEEQNQRLSKKIKKAFIKEKLTSIQSLETKIQQLNNTLNIRFGVMIVGEAGSAKTTSQRILKEALQKEQKVEVETTVLNPKSITMAEMYGWFDPETKEWRDGQLSRILRNYANSSKSSWKWVVLDGPIDALWIENLNTVLDDNRKLCLASGELIRMNESMRIIFEIDHMRMISPATISRCGAVYFIQQELRWKDSVKSWIHKRFANDQKQTSHLTEQQLQYLLELFDGKAIPLLLDSLRSESKEPIPTIDLQIVNSLCNLLEVFLVSGQFEWQQYDWKSFINYAFAFAVIQTFGLTVNQQFCKQIELIIREQFKSLVLLPSEDIFGCFIDTSNMQKELSFKSWKEKSKQIGFTYPEQVRFSEIFIPTDEVLRYQFIMEKLLDMEKEIYVTGAPGTGKSLLIESVLLNAKKKPFYLPFSSHTKADQTKECIQNQLLREKFQPFVIDDINMPVVECYGAQPPIELLRTIVDRGQLFQNQNEYADVHFIACSGYPTKEIKALTQRFTRHFNVINMHTPSEAALIAIYSSILSGFSETKPSYSWIKESMTGIISSTVDLYTKIGKELTAIPSKFHYNYNLRDVSKVFEGMLLILQTMDVKGTEDQLNRLWVHETERVFADRLVGESDKQWFDDALSEITQKHFATKWQQKDKILFNNHYEEMKDPKALTEKVQQYNQEKRVELVLFEYARDHLLRILRVLNHPRGNMMLLGMNASGKQTLVRLGSYIMGYQLKEISVEKHTDLRAFRTFIMKELVHPAGVEAKPTVFLFRLNQITNEQFLEDINNLLKTGQVPQLLPEIQEIAEKAKLPYSKFCQTIRDSLHIMLCMSPADHLLRKRCSMFPALISCCTLDWFHNWPSEALFEVVGKIIQTENLVFKKENLQEIAKQLHQIVYSKAELIITPRNFIDFAKLFQKELNQKQNELKFKQSVIDKLSEQKVKPSKLEELLTELKDQLAKEENTLIGNLLLSTAAVSYCGPFLKSDRIELMNSWKSKLKDYSLPFSEDFSISSQSAMIRDWQNFSLENAIFSLNGNKLPLLIDPEQQAKTWISHQFKEKHLVTVKQSDPKLSSILKKAQQNGHPVLIPDIAKEEIQQLLDKLERSLASNCNSNLFLTTTAPLKHYFLPEICSRVNIINCSLTFEELNDQLLLDLVQKASPELHEKITQNLLAREQLERQLTEAQQQIAGQSNVCEDAEFLSAILAKQQSKADNIKLGLELSKQLEEMKELYKPISIRATTLYFVVKDLQKIEPMYQYSVDYIKNLVMNAVSQKQQVNDQIDLITRTIHTNVSWGLFEKDKQQFSLMMALALQQQCQELEKPLSDIPSYIQSSLGTFYIEPILFDMQKFCNSCSCNTPLLFLHSQGVDPRNLILTYTEQISLKKEHLQIIQLGQGQGRITRKAIAEGVEKGHWVVLVNCHLSPSFMNELTEIMNEFIFENEGINKAFRLVLTTMPNWSLPETILSKSIKVAMEQPKGFKNRIKSSLCNLSDELLDSVPTKRNTLSKLLLGLAYFHAIVQERNNYSPIGWNRTYEFNDCDFETSKSNIINLLSETKSEDIPWEAMKFAIGNLNYGGRVNDSWDQLCLISLLNSIFNERSLKDTIPQLDNMESFHQHVDELPVAIDSEVLGLHENAFLKSQQSDNQRIKKLLSSIYSPKEISPNDFKQRIQQILNELPKSFDIAKELSKNLFQKNQTGQRTPLSQCLLQEIEKYNQLLTRIQETLTNLLRAIDGLETMSPELEEIKHAINSNQIPNSWSKFAYSSEKPLASWLLDLKERISFFQKWLEQGKIFSYQLSAFFYPQSFLAAVLSTHSRKYQISIDRLVFKCSIQDFEEISTEPMDGVYIHGLFLEGAKWDQQKQTLVEESLGEFYCKMPIIHLLPTEQPGDNKQEYTCPVYKTGARGSVHSNFIFSLNLPCNESPEFWTLRGTALICQTND